MCSTLQVQGGYPPPWAVAGEPSFGAALLFGCGRGIRTLDYLHMRQGWYTGTSSAHNVMVAPTGFEPVRPCGHPILRRARLPFHHGAMEPEGRFELPTSSLRRRRSTAELPRLGFGAALWDRTRTDRVSICRAEATTPERHWGGMRGLNPPRWFHRPVARH